MNRAKKCPCGFVMKPTIYLDIARERWDQSLTFRCDPIKNNALKTFSVIGSGTRSSFTNLPEDVKETCKKIKWFCTRSATWWISVSEPVRSRSSSPGMDL